MCVSNTTDCTTWKSYRNLTTWALAPAGDTKTRTVNVWFKDASDNISAQYSDTIDLVMDRLVCPRGCTYSTVQAAVSASGPGDVVKVAQGTYNENIAVSTSQEFSIQCGWDTGFAIRVKDPALTVLSGDTTGDGLGDGSVISLSAGMGANITAAIDNCTIIGGSADKGGGIRITSNGNVDLTLTNNLLLRNSAYAGGGIGANAAGAGLATLNLTNNVIAGNAATDAGGGIYIGAETGGNATLSMTNNTITGNEALLGGGLYADSITAGSTTITSQNNIIWGNDIPISEIFLNQSGSTTTLSSTYSDISTVEDNTGTYEPGIGDINENPVLVNPALDNYRLNSDSPCIDTATAVGAPSEDIEGHPRPQGIGYDMGADEYMAAAYAKLELLSLDGGEAIKSGRPYDITWWAPRDAVTFKVKYSFDNGLSWRTPLDNTVSGSTHYSWDVPALIKNKKRCLVKVTAYDASNRKIGSDKSDANFGIETVRLLTPNEEVTLTSGITQPIKWKTTPYPARTVESVDLYYTIDSGLSWYKITTVTGNPGTYDWPVPSVGSAKTRCRIRVVLRDSQGKALGSDKSDGSFTISP
jgi:hypothetical protein